ncbi:MAG: lipid kinase [Paraprevotella sp.]|nr:lipid kinase [Paraprevotella sp.]
MESSRWGLIYCPKEGVRHIHKEWEEISAYLAEKNVSYDFVQSEDPKSVERLAAMLAANGYTTIIIVGGDAALNRALNGILSQGDEVRSRVALGVIPNGWGNDFAHFWGFEEANYKQTIDWLVKRRLRKVDVGYCISEAVGKDKPRYFLNCLNVGLVANIMNIKHKTRRFWGVLTLSHVSSIFLLLFQRMEHKMHFKVNQDEIDRSVMTVCVGSARGYGQTPSGVPYNGLLDVSVVSHPEMSQMIEAMWMLVRGRFLNHKAVISYRTRKVDFYDCGKAMISLDGAVWENASAPMTVGIHPEWIDFIIPV